MSKHKKIVPDRTQEDMLRLIKTGYVELQGIDLYSVLESEAKQIMDILPLAGFEAVHHCLETMYTYEKNGWYYGSKNQIVDGLDKYVSKLMGQCGITRDMVDGRMKIEHVYFPEETHEQVALALMHIMVHSDYEFVRVDSHREMKYLSKSGSRRAKDFLKFGTGVIPSEYHIYRDQNVKISANDIKWGKFPYRQKGTEPEVSIEVLNENEAAYSAAIDYLINMISATALQKTWYIKLKSEVGPKDKAANDDTNQFWNNCLEYHALSPLVEQFTRSVPEFQIISKSLRAFAIEKGVIQPSEWE